jgi:NADPH-dependent curcumin reductase
MNVFSRIIVCGLISDYNAASPYELKNIRSVLVNRIRMQGMIVFDWHQRYPEARSELAAMLQQGKLKCRESVAEGIESAPQAFIRLLKGGNFGKQLVKLA